MKKINRILVTGCAGFIGSNLVDQLLKQGFNVFGVDNLSTGRIEFLKEAQCNVNFCFNELDLTNSSNLNDYMADIKVDEVFHLAANADVRFGLNHPMKDLEQNTYVTFNILEGMRKSGVSKIYFASTGSVYGEAPIIPTPENCPFPVQTSLYGASKLACEGLISAYCVGYNFTGVVFRFVSILGERYTHGHVFDFYSKLKSNKKYLEVLGNGKQRKSYLYVKDCIDAMLSVRKFNHQGYEVYNLGTDDTCTVSDSVRWITEELNINPDVLYGESDRGWIGDNPHIHLDTSKIRKTGWLPNNSIELGIKKTVRYIKSNEWIFDKI